MERMRFNNNAVIWDDRYSGRYLPPEDYSQEFDLQWKLALEGNPDYYNNPGASIDDKYIEDRIYEWTGIHPRGVKFFDVSMGSRVLDHPIDVGLIKDKDCIDIGCGMGRWTKTMLNLGARSVLSLDMSDSALNSVKKFNSNVQKVNVFEILEKHNNLIGRFDFACFWGVAMCTHDPLMAFLNAASTVKNGGAMYLMVYAQEGIHGKHLTKLQREHFHSLKNVSERLIYIDHIYNRKWDHSYPLNQNMKNFIKNIINYPKGSKVGILDMLEPVYNWVIPLDVIHGWMERAGFNEVIVLNEDEKPKCAYHILGKKA